MKKILLLFTFVFLSACASSTAPKGGLSVPDYSAFGTTRLKVGSVEVINDYVPPLSAPNVDHALYLPPYSAIQEWATKRFQAVGNIGVARIHIVEASIKKRDLPMRDGLEYWFRDQIDAEYDLRAVVRLEVISPSYDNLPYAQVNVNRRLQTTNAMSMAQRDKALHDMVITMLEELDRLMAQSVKANLSSAIY